MAFIKYLGFILITVVLFTYHLTAQQKMTNYDKLWKNVDSLANKKGLTKSALIEVDKIYTLAKKEKQDAQLIKALLFQASLKQMTEEDADLKTMISLENEIKTTEEPAKSLLHSILAEKYRNYFQQHRWQFYNRTNTINFKKEDIATWTIDDLHAKITTLFLASIKQEKLLQQTALEAFDLLITKGNVRHLRPTLYDLLAHRALDYFKDEERDINKPAYAFQINDENYFANAAVFSKLNIVTKDSSSLYYKALLTYQKLLSFHLNDAKPNALIDADIDRLQFIQQFGVMENKDDLYEKGLRTITEKYKEVSLTDQAYYLIAQLHADKAATYEPFTFEDNDPNNPKEKYIIAAAICKKVIAQKEETEGKANCYNLLKQIERKELNLNTEKVNVPDQAFRTLVSYRNFTQLYFRIIPLTDDIKKQLVNTYDDNYWSKLTKLSFTKTWSQALPATNDYQKHFTEIAIDALPIGAYILLASTTADFTLEKNPLAIQNFYVSNISYINNSSAYFALHRETGKPLAGANIQIWRSEYDYNTRQYINRKEENLTADKNGYFFINNKKENRTINIEITYEKDRLLMGDQQYISSRVEAEAPQTTNNIQFEKNNAQVFFFTDRSIYRPGQTVYFKGIALTKDANTKKNKIYVGISSKIIVRNANGEEVITQQLKTNEYGSYSGSFKLPENVLNGDFTLNDELLHGNVSFSVEEYKRPKFYVDYEKLKGSYKVNENITVTGFAKAYAGNNIDGAQVKYRVQRVARFIYPWLYWKCGYPRGSNMEITNGVVTTNAEGKFTITFKAIPDLSVNKNFDPLFDYTVTADITDTNGETRTGEKTVSVSYKALQLNINLPIGENIAIDSFKTIGITTQNMNAEPEAALVKVTVAKLQSPNRLIRKRYWQQPDQFTMTKEVFLKTFPDDEYANETDYRAWPKEKNVFEKTDSANNSTAFKCNSNLFAEGWYSIEATTKDKYGVEVKDIKYIQLYDEKSKTIPAFNYTWYTQKNAAATPGTASTILIGTSAKDVFLIQQIDKANENSNDTAAKNNSYSFFNVSNEKRSFVYTATEADRGGFGVHHFFVKNNRFYLLSNTVVVPWSNKDLNISYATFRDKTLPGSEEKWKIKISGYKKEKLAAEMLASMYDASLDQFKPHQWQKPSIWGNYYNINNWLGTHSFNQTQSQEKYWNEELKAVQKTYDQLNTMQTIFARGGMQRMSMSKTAMAEPAMEAMAEVTVKANGNKKEELEHDKASLGDTVNTTSKQGNQNKVDNNIQIQIRKNFNETAFFFPDLKTDTAGNIEFGFTMPEALTQWKFQALAHTQDLAMGYSTNTVITQKPLMVQPNAPRFLREGDKMELSTKVVNLTDKEITGNVQLELMNTATGESVSGWFHNISPTQFFTAAAGQSTVVRFSVEVPYQYNSAVTYRFIAKTTSAAASTPGKNNSTEMSDGEEAAIPVLTNSMLVTESITLPMRGNSTKNFTFEKLLQSNKSETLQQHALTVEFTTNPSWYAVQALPYLMEKPTDCVEQIFNQYYANALATKIANASPKLKEIVEKWKTSDTAALLSNLEKNQELKSILLQETPWVMDAKNETQQKKNVALLFDMLRMSKELSANFEKLKQMQSSNGGFVWVKGGQEDRYMTQYIITGIGHLKKLGALNTQQQKDWGTVITSAINYLDQRIKEDYDNLLKYKTVIKNNNLGYTAIQYLYMRSFFTEYSVPGASFTAVNYYRKQTQQYWLQQSKYMQGMIALSLFRSGDIKTATDIVKSLQQNAVVNEELGMYWKDNSGGYYWHQAPVEIQCLLIETFTEINKDTKTIDDLKTWLLKQKQTRAWKTTKATADACYALLLQGSDWLNNTPAIDIKLGDKTFSSNNLKQEAGTGYFKEKIEGKFIQPAMGNITVKVTNTTNQPNTASAWGAVYWQYFEHLDKITPAATPLKLNKKLFVEKNTDKGPVLQPIIENTTLKVGDKIKVRIELRVDRDMEYVHMKDMRASCMEPVNVLSNYKWQGGLGYYESTKDASTNFFFGWLPKGTYVFEYPLFITHKGNFSNGITSIQCMYAPEFISHSEGIRVSVE